MLRGIKTIRWTIEFAASEFGKPRERVSLALKTAGLKAGKDGKFNTRQITEALYESAALEREAIAAKHQQQIDEAAMVKAERELKEGQTVYRSAVRDRVADVFTQACQIVRQWDVSERKKKELIKSLSDLKLEPVKIIEFAGAGRL